MDSIANDCYINGRPVKDVIGAENIPNFVNHAELRKANYNVPRMLQEAVDAAEATVEEPPQPSGMKIQFTIPHNIEEWANSIKERAEQQME